MAHVCAEKGGGGGCGGLLPFLLLIPLSQTKKKMKPWQGNALADQRRITFVKAVKPTNAFAAGASSAVRGGVVAPPAAAAGTVPAAPVFTPSPVPDDVAALVEWKVARRAGPGLFNLGNTCFLNSVMQVGGRVGDACPGNRGPTPRTAR
jgi:hypothetical protein